MAPPVAHILVWKDHIRPARQVMKMFEIVFERIPMVWFLLGLLFNAAGLYLGFEFSLAFAYMIIGWFCCAYGLALFVFRFRERPKSSTATRLSPKFVSAGSTVVMPRTPTGGDAQATPVSSAE